MVKASARIAAMRGKKSLIWADKAALGIAVAIAGVAFIVWLLAAIALKNMSDASFNLYILQWTANAELAVVLPLWFGLRAVDYVVNRRLRLLRKGGREPEPPAPPSVNVQE